MIEDSRNDGQDPDDNERVIADASQLPVGLEQVLESAARLQQLVPDAVLVGGTAAAYYAHHRLSTDHDHVLVDLKDRFDLVLEALDRESEFVLNRATPGKIILGELGGIEAGVRQMIRQRPLEVQQVTLRSGGKVTVPSRDEISRIKGYLIVKRNQMRDYLDVVALSARFGAASIGAALSTIDDYYSDDTHAADRPIQSQLARQLSDPSPKDQTRISELRTYKQLIPRWQNWDEVVAESRRLATHVM